MTEKTRGEKMIALATLNRHLNVQALGGAHPIVVVVPRKELEIIIEAMDDILRPEK